MSSLFSYLWVTECRALAFGTRPLVLRTKPFGLGPTGFHPLRGFQRGVAPKSQRSFGNFVKVVAPLGQDSPGTLIVMSTRTQVALKRWEPLFF